MKKGANGLPDPTKVEMFANLGIYPVDLKVGPGGDLFFVDIGYGAIRRITYTGDDNRAPTARAVASPPYGPGAARGRVRRLRLHRPRRGDTLTYEWDLDGDGEYDDSTEEHPRVTYPEGSHEVTPPGHRPAAAPATRTRSAIDSGETPPTASRSTHPAPRSNWHVGQNIDFSGSATDEQDGPLPVRRLSPGS